MCSLGESSPFVALCLSASAAAVGVDGSEAREKEAGDSALLSSLLVAIRASVVPAAASSLACWDAACATVLCICCVSVSRCAQSAGWGLDALTSALSALVELHRTAHCQLPLSDVAKYSQCRQHLSRLLAARSADLPPFAHPLLTTQQCATVLSCTESLYFPSLHLSQLTVRRAAQLTCQPLDTTRAQQAQLDRLAPLSAAMVVDMPVAATAVQDGAAVEVTAAAQAVAAAAPLAVEGAAHSSSDSHTSTDVDIHSLTALSDAAQSALSAMRAEYSGRFERCNLQLNKRQSVR